MKKTMIALFASVALFAGLSSTADAKVSVYFGVPYYNYQVGPDYMFNNNYGWYRPAFRTRISCNEARRIVRESGFRNVARRECEGRTYTFTAMRRGHQILVYVNSRTGAVWNSRTGAVWHG